jgi:hypothetical protein
MPRELAVALQNQIAQSHERCVDLSKQLEQILIDQLAATRETGILFQTARADLTPGEFKELRDAVGIDSAAVQNYINFARTHQEPVTRLADAVSCMKTVLQRTGLLESRGLSSHRVQPPENFWIYAAKTVRTLIDFWNRFTRGRELSQNEKDQALAILSPLLEIARSLR